MMYPCLCLCWVSGCVVLLCHEYDVCKTMLAVCMLVGMVVWAKVDSVSSVNSLQLVFV